MEPHDMSVMQWQPPFLRLNSVPNPDVNSGESSPIFIAPQHITLIDRQCVSYNKSSDRSEYWPPREGTRVVIGPNFYEFVTEDPETVALMRDRALGHKPTLTST